MTRKCYALFFLLCLLSPKQQGHEYTIEGELQAKLYAVRPMEACEVAVPRFPSGSFSLSYLGLILQCASLHLSELSGSRRSYTNSVGVQALRNLG